MQVTCSDFNCIYNTAGICTAPDGIDHTSDRFCVTGRKKPRDETSKLMQPNIGICRREGGSMKRKGGSVLK